MLSGVKRLFMLALALAALAFLGYATLVSHAQRPCFDSSLTSACKKYVGSSGK
jgi:hypothetical protein